MPQEPLLDWLEDERCGVLRDLLTRNDLVPLLHLSRRSKLSAAGWANDLRMDLKHLHDALSPLSQTPLRYPGFAGPTKLRVLSEHTQETPRWIGVPGRLLNWVSADQKHTLKPEQAISEMNTWPPHTRTVAANLATFLQHTHASFFYAAVHRQQSAQPTIDLHIRFEYRGIAGCLCRRETSSWPY